jgi:hypothetical protein
MFFVGMPFFSTSSIGFPGEDPHDPDSRHSAGGVLLHWCFQENGSTGANEDAPASQNWLQ